MNLLKHFYETNTRHNVGRKWVADVLLPGWDTTQQVKGIIRRETINSWQVAIQHPHQEILIEYPKVACSNVEIV